MKRLSVSDGSMMKYKSPFEACYTRCGTLLSATYAGEIYDPETGTLLAEIPSLPNLWGESLWGLDDAGKSILRNLTGATSGALSAPFQLTSILSPAATRTASIGKLKV